MSSHIAIPTETGQVYVTGPNAYGQLSLGTKTQTNNFSLAKFDDATNLSGIIQSSVGSAHSIFLKSTGTVYSCGMNTNGQLGLGTTEDVSFSNIVLSSASSVLGNVVAVAAGASHSLFLLSDGSALSCGLNTSSQLGDGTVIQRSYPVNVLKSAGTFLNPVVSLAGGASHSVFALADGTAWACGLNTNNQVGDGTTTSRAYATQVKTDAVTFLTNVTQVAAGELYCLALTASGDIFGWGRNNSGQLALGTTVDAPYASPCLYSAGVSMTGIVAIASHSNHSLFLTAGGTVYSCGLNTNGQLGDGTLTSRSYPVVVLTASGAPLTDVVSIGTAGNQSYFVKADGTIFACGTGSGGGLGNGGLTDLSYATQVLSSGGSGMKKLGYSAAYWKNQGSSAATLSTSGFTALDLVNAGYFKEDLSNAGITVANINNVGTQKLYSLGYSHADIVNGTNNTLSKIGQYTVASGKLGTLMTGGLLDAPKTVNVTGRSTSSISVAIGAPGFNSGLTGYSVEAVPVTGGTTVTKSLGVAGTLVDGLVGGKIYDLKVRSVNAAGSSTAITQRNSTALSVPASLTAGSITGTGMTITFATALATQDCSYVLRTIPATNQYLLTTGNTQAITGLIGGTTYTIYLDASNGFAPVASVNTSATTVSIPVPLQISGGLLWLDSTDATSYTKPSANVTQWNDKSPNAKNMTLRTGTGIGPGPTLASVTANSKTNTIFDFSNKSSFINSTFVMPTIYTIFMVGYTTAPSSYGRLIAGLNDFGVFVGSSGSNYATFVGTTTGGGWNDVTANTPNSPVNTLKVFGLTNNNTSGGLIPYVNGVAQDAKNGATKSFTSLVISHTDFDQFWNGYLGEVIIYNSVLSTTNRQAVETYLKNKWGTA